MPTRDSYAPGTPSWVDMSSPDVDASKAFYTQLFGWEAEDQFDGEGNRIYVMFRLNGADVAGLGGQPPGMPPGMPPIWNTYVATADVDASLAAVQAAGGTVMMPGMEVMSAGKMAAVGDPSGAAIFMWQAGDHIGSSVVNEAGAPVWNELLTRDVDGVKPFYSAVFGWQYDDMPMGENAPPYSVFNIGGDAIGGIMAMPPSMPAQVPNHWNVYFGTDDVDATATRVKDLGGSVVAGPMDTPAGRLATLHDNTHGSFSVIKGANADS